MSGTVTPDDSTMIHRMYTEMIGIDDQGGLVSNQREIKKDVAWIKANMVTEEECLDRRVSCEEHAEKIKDKAINKKRSTWLVVKDVILVMLSIFMFIIAYIKVTL